ncbi:MAG TPA: STAS domain-containing protein [Dehalococcoidia bacterium]|jgi:anti-anti-sigma regulatory factor|nr:STAS domain-containing protein [Dehalococcoidia bacterium]
MTKEMKEIKASTPIAVVWEGILLLPIIGIIDSKRAQEIMELALEEIARREARVLILDIMGVPTVDTAVANHLIKITKAAKLMGCECIISGIAPMVAQSMVNLGIDLGNIIPCSSLREAIACAFETIGFEIRKISK